MDIEGIKSGRKIEKSNVDVSKLPKDAGVLSKKEERKVPGFRERVSQARKKFSKSMEQRKKSQIKRLETKASLEEKKESALERRYSAKAKTAKMKAELAEYRKRKRAASPFAGVGKLFKPSQTPEARHAKVTKTKDMLEMEKVHRAREQFRGQMEYEREYQQKFGVRPEGSGELPYYEKEHLKPLPKREAAKIIITNHEHVTKKKSLKDELL